MVTGPQNVSPERPSTPPRLELFSHTAGTALLLTYGLGFLIVSLHEARFGIAHFNPFRAKIFAAGFVFGCLAALPAAALHYGFTYYSGFEPAQDVSNPQIVRYREIVLLLAFYMTAWMMAAASSFLFVPSQALPHPWWFLGFLVTATMFFFVSYGLIASHLSERPKACVLLAASAILVMFAVVKSFGQQLSNLLTAWYFGVGVFAFLVGDSSNPLKQALDWRNWLAAALLVGFYASGIYGDIQAKYGGGAPTPVVVYLNKPSAWLDSDVLSVQLLDETEGGYFVLPPGTDKALFIPRSNVTALYFGSMDQVPRKK